MRTLRRQRMFTGLRELEWKRKILRGFRRYGNKLQLDVIVIAKCVVLVAAGFTVLSHGTNLRFCRTWQVKAVSNSTQLHATHIPTNKEIQVSTWRKWVLEWRGRRDDQFWKRNPLCVLVYYSSCWHYEFGSYNSTGFIGENATEFDFFSPLPAGNRGISFQLRAVLMTLACVKRMEAKRVQ
uniref:Uncharacterized protein n=1 Tax=Brassica campestris TaxID=3711 RepID=M4CSE1_BRACM